MNPMIDFATYLQSLGTAGTFVVVVLKATLILLIARLLLAVLTRVSAAAKHLGVTIALCGVLMLPFVSFVLPAWRVAVLPPQTVEEAVTSPRAGIGSTGDDQEYGALSAAVTVVQATGVVPQERITAIQTFFNTIRHSWKGIVLIGIAMVSLLLLARMVVGIFGVGSVARSSTEILDDVALQELDRARDHLQLGREVRLLRSERVTVPVVWGVMKPVLLLPASSADWSRERLRVVLLHELAHVKRGDGITLLLTKAAVAVFWFHPLMWTLERAGRAECERACDDLVLATGTKPSDYAEHLLNIARALPHFDPFRSVTLAMSRRSQLEGRLLSILQPHIRRGNFSLRAVSLVSALALLIIVPLASVRLVAAPRAETATQTARQGTVDFGPNYASKVAGAPQLLFEKMSKLRKGDKEKTPETGEEWYDRGMDLHRSDRYPEAIAAFHEAIRAGYRVGGSTYNIACGYALMGDSTNAVRWLQKAVEEGYDIDHALDDSDFDPIRTDREFQRVVGAATDGRGDDRVNETAQRYASLKAGNSTDGEEWFDVGLDLLRLRMLDQSIDAYTRAINFGQKSSTAMYNIACAYSLKGDVASAKRWLDQAIDHGFDNIEKLNNDPDIANLRRDPDFARTVALADELKLHTGKWDWGFFKDEEGAWRAALPRYQALTVKYPTTGRAWFNYGYALLQSHENAQSAAAFQRAIDLGYRKPTSTYNLACAYARDGQVKAAIDTLERARALGFELANYLEEDSDLEALHDEPRFQELRRQVEAEHDSDHDHESKAKHKKANKIWTF